MWRDNGQDQAIVARIKGFVYKNAPGWGWVKHIVLEPVRAEDLRGVEQGEMASIQTKVEPQKPEA